MPEPREMQPIVFMEAVERRSKQHPSFRVERDAAPGFSEYVRKTKSTEPPTEAQLTFRNHVTPSAPSAPTDNSPSSFPENDIPDV